MGFPQAGEVRFDPASQDFLVGGKERGVNGKGVRAILHAAFKVSIMLFCYRNGLPHPGLLVLDTPLLTYREPLDRKHGELSNDEVVIKKSGLAERFYEHLASLEDVGRFLILENTDPPSSISGRAAVHVLTGDKDQGRPGLL